MTTTRVELHGFRGLYVSRFGGGGGIRNGLSTLQEGYVVQQRE